MLLVVVNGYVSEENPSKNAFVHSRVLGYLDSGIPTRVFVVQKKCKKSEYEYENVHVYKGSPDDLAKMINNDGSIRICMHFINGDMISALNKVESKRKVFIFVHGVEALYWYQRIFKGTFGNMRLILGFIKYSINNIIEIRRIRRFLNTNRHDCCFIAVSGWMKEIAEKNWKCNGKFRWEIIPNYVNNSRFPYVEKNANDAFNAISIRAFSSGKYANDITVKVIKDLNENDAAKNMSFCVVGDGPLYEKTITPIIKYENVSFERRMLQQNEISSWHQKYGVFICPTRQDAQGVSMCEAMSSGLVPITLYNTAIPEFLPDEKLKCRNETEMVRLIEYLISNPDEYLRLSRKCSEFISDKCSKKNTIEKEISFFKVDSE